eukprot:SAG31_NODE_2194_length_6224_cov_3.140408_8_plen_74_part_00
MLSTAVWHGSRHHSVPFALDIKFSPINIGFAENLQHGGLKFPRKRLKQFCAAAQRDVLLKFWPPATQFYRWVR